MQRGIEPSAPTIRRNTNDIDLPELQDFNAKNFDSEYECCDIHFSDLDALLEHFEQNHNFRAHPIALKRPATPDQGLQRPVKVRSIQRPAFSVPRVLHDPSLDLSSLVIVEFKAGRTDLFYNPASVQTICKGDIVIVEGNHGKDLGRVMSDSVTLDQVKSFISHKLGEGREFVITLGKVLRRAELKDVESFAKKASEEVHALELCLEKVRAKDLTMEVVYAEYQWDRRNLTFYFTFASQKSRKDRMNFEELVRELFRHYKIPILFKFARLHPSIAPEPSPPDLLNTHSKVPNLTTEDTPPLALQSQSIVIEKAGIELIETEQNTSSHQRLLLTGPPKQALVPSIEPEGQSLRNQKCITSQMTNLIQRVQTTLENKQDYRKLLAQRNLHAQRLLDMFQRLLDVLTDASLSFRRNLIVATQRLAAASELYPVSYELSNVTTPELPECSGASAEIYKGDFRGRPVCVKTIRLHRNTEISYFMKVVSKEAILWGQLRHPNLLPFYGVYRYKGRVSLVSPWMENGVIGEYLSRHTTANRVVLAHDVAQGLEFLHKNGIIHGDLKGKNVLVNDFGRACVADFGLSSISDKEILAWTSFSSAASKGGTPRYQAPELFDLESGEQQCNTRASDMYAWACVAYEIFAGELPFAHLTRELAILKYISNGGQPTRPPASSTSWNVWGLTEAIWALMQTCWNLKPKARPSVEAVVDHLVSSLPPDVHKDACDHPLSPGQFREMMRECVDENGMSLAMFDSLMSGG